MVSYHLCIPRVPTSNILHSEPTSLWACYWSKAHCKSGKTPRLCLNLSGFLAVLHFCGRFRRWHRLSFSLCSQFISTHSHCSVNNNTFTSFARNVYTSSEQSTSFKNRPGYNPPPNSFLYALDMHSQLYVINLSWPTA